MLLVAWWLWAGGNFKAFKETWPLMSDTTTVISSPLGSPHCQDHKNTQLAKLVFPSCASPRSFLLLISCLPKTQFIRNLFGIGFFLVPFKHFFLMYCQFGNGMPFYCGLLLLMSAISARGYMVTRPYWIYHILTPW